MNPGPVKKAKKPWYSEGLCFSCTGCGNCCRIEGYVWVTRDRIRRIASHLGMTEEDFSGKYVRKVGRRYSLTEKPNHDCIFWDEGCTIYTVRPGQCRTRIASFLPDERRLIDGLRLVVVCSDRVYAFAHLSDEPLDVALPCEHTLHTAN